MSKQSGIKSMDYVAENVKNVYKNNPMIIIKICLIKTHQHFFNLYVIF